MQMLDILKVLYTQKYYCHNTFFLLSYYSLFLYLLTLFSFFLAILIYYNLLFQFFLFSVLYLSIINAFIFFTGYSQKSQVYCIIYNCQYLFIALYYSLYTFLQISIIRHGTCPRRMIFIRDKCCVTCDAILRGKKTRPC